VQGKSSSTKKAARLHPSVRSIVRAGMPPEETEISFLFLSYLSEEFLGLVALRDRWAMSLSPSTERA
jgi:hypothetical protein